MVKSYRSILFGLAFCAGLSIAAGPDQFVPGRLLVKFRAGTPPERAQAVLSSLGARRADELAGIGVHVVELPAAASEAAYAHAFEARPEVEFAELDGIVPPADVVPNDPYHTTEWQLNKIQAPTAWSTTTGSSSIIIAILDSGVDAAHADLASKVRPGWNVYNNNSDTHDVYGHGTKVAGTAAAATNNALGVSAVAWNCPIMPVRITDTSGYTTYSAVAQGLTWAADNGARVANVSFQATNSSTVDSAASYFQGKGGVVTMSAGNSAAFDSAADDRYIILVSGTDPNDALYSWSNTGNNIDVAAPGCVGTTTTNGGGYAGTCGTSFSAPLTAGVAALVLSVNPSLNAQDVTRILQQSADDLGTAGWDSKFGWGRLNAARAVSQAASGGPPPDTQPPAVSITSPAAGATLTGTVTIQVGASDNVGVASVSVTANGTLLGTDTTAPYSFTWDTTRVTNGSYTLAATAKDAAGNQATASITVTVSNVVVADTTAPTVSIASPLNGTTVSGNVSVLVNATDNVRVVRAELYVDGKLSATSTQAPFTMRWNTKKAAKGAHLLYVKAYDAAGNAGSSPSVNVTK